MLANASRITRSIRRYPVSSSSVLLTVSAVSYAAYTERKANQSIEQWKRSLADTQRQEQTVSLPVLLPRQYHWETIYKYWSSRPITASKRLFEITYELVPLALEYMKDIILFPSYDSDQITTKRIVLAKKLCESLTNLGPAFVKFGQQLSIRPDLVPDSVLKELRKLCDSVRPIDDEVALQLIGEQLNDENISKGESSIFEERPVLVASASLGQVYKARLRGTNQDVAIKIQRPGMLENFSLDLFLLQHVGIIVDSFTSVFTNQPPFHKALYETFAMGSYQELDYENEASNQIQFKNDLESRKCPVIIPSVHLDLTTRYVLTTEWIEGRKLADAPNEQIRQLIPVGVELFLTQLLDLGRFHSDPHPGNLLVNEEGKLCLLDFGLCTDVDEQSRKALTKAIVHLIIRDFETLISHDSKELGFLPDDFDTTELKPLLTKILTVGVVDSGSDIRKRSRKLMEISNELNEVFFKYPFSVPPFFALVTRGLCLLEGIALSGDPDFNIFEASIPFTRDRAITLLGPEHYYFMVSGTRYRSK